MIRAALVLFALLAGCDDFHAVQQADTIEAYEAWIAENPDHRMMLHATTRLEDLYLERARGAGSLAAYDAYLARFPEGVYRDKAMAEREAFLFDQAAARDTVAAWEAFLAEYPRASKKRKAAARAAIAVAGYREHLTLSPPRLERVNLAEDPEGPLDGWAVRVDVTNTGEETLQTLILGAELPAGLREWPVAAPTWRVPLEEELRAPLRPGETRTWTWTTGELPESFEGELVVRPTSIRLES